MEELVNTYQTVSTEEVLHWEKVGSVSDFPANAGGCIKYKSKQVAVFYFEKTQSWYACQNLCPHKLEMVLSRGMTGDAAGIPKVSCPLHKKSFSLEDGSNLNGEEYRIATYPVRIEHGNVYIGFAD
ncbi:MAG: nitrite reductase small subunit NirD [Cyclobacteriaceae bacterium]|nr:nitrite reductase small subunit NirD [Cyclobacteriaceae bacterium]MDX5467667.1 nitrite reductase small subunit NirD [Cyclobacteriaceae bacterium]